MGTLNGMHLMGTLIGMLLTGTLNGMHSLNGMH